MLRIFALLICLAFFGCDDTKTRMPENKIAISNRLVIIDGPTLIGRQSCWIVEDTLTKNEYLINGSSIVLLKSGDNL